MEPTFGRLFVDVMSGFEVLLAPTFVVVLFTLLDQDWTQFMKQRWQARMGAWARNLCLIGGGATLEFIVQYSELQSLTANYNVYPKLGGQLALSLRPMAGAEVILILLLLMIPTVIIAAVNLVMRQNIHAWAATICLFFGGVVLCLPLIIRCIYLGAVGL
jgi:hypothetical protein